MQGYLVLAFNLNNEASFPLSHSIPTRTQKQGHSVGQPAERS